jgi:hypothetical protein
MVGSFDRTIHAVQMSQDLHDLLLHHENIVFRVHSIFRGSVNLLSPAEELVTIARTDVDMMPMGMTVDLSSAHIAWPFEVDDSVVYNGQLEFVIPKNENRIRLRHARVWRPILSAPSGEIACASEEALSMIKKTLLELDSGGVSSVIRFIDGDTRESSCTSIYARFITGDICSFIDAVEAKDWERSLYQAELLVGFGPGLTPSCDDFLAAFILSLHYMNQWNHQDDQALLSFLQSIVELARSRTTIVSYSMLRHASAGKASDSYLKILEALATHNLPELRRAIDRVLEFGATSGADFLFGIWCVQTIISRWARQEECVLQKEDLI